MSTLKSARTIKTHLDQLQVHHLGGIIHAWGRYTSLNIPEGLSHSLAGEILKCGYSATAHDLCNALEDILTALGYGDKPSQLDALDALAIKGRVAIAKHRGER